jgi:hypothetical protein
MKTLSAALFSFALVAVNASASFAQMTAAPAMPDMKTPAMSAMPACPANDPAVGVNTATKMYMTQAQMKAHTAGMTADQKAAMMKSHHVTMMCQSKAEAMGAKAMAAPSGGSHM